MAQTRRGNHQCRRPAASRTRPTVAAADLAGKDPVLSSAALGRRRDQLRILLRAGQRPRPSRPGPPGFSARSPRRAHPLADRRQSRPYGPNAGQCHGRAEEPPRLGGPSPQTKIMEPHEARAFQRYTQHPSERYRYLSAQCGIDEPADLRPISLCRRYLGSSPQGDLSRPVAAPLAGRRRAMGGQGYGQVRPRESAMQRYSPVGGVFLILAAVASLCASAPEQPTAARRTFPEPTKFDPKPTALGDDSAEMLAVVYSPDRETLATGGADKLVKLWDSASGKLLASLGEHGDAIAGLAFSPDGKILASASYEQTVKLWDVAARKELRTLTGHQNWIFGVVFSPDRKFLASASYDRTVKIWDVTSGA